MSRRFFGRRRPKAIAVDISEEQRAIDPACSIQDWIEWLMIVRPDEQAQRQLESGFDFQGNQLDIGPSRHRALMIRRIIE